MAQVAQVAAQHHAHHHGSCRVGRGTGSRHDVQTNLDTKLRGTAPRTPEHHRVYSSTNHICVYVSDLRMIVVFFKSNIHYYTLLYTIIHYYTLLYTIIHYYTLLYNYIHAKINKFPGPKLLSPAKTGDPNDPPPTFQGRPKLELPQ